MSRTSEGDHLDQAMRMALIELEQARLPVARIRTQLLKDQAAQRRLAPDGHQMAVDDEANAIPNAAHARELLVVAREHLLVPMLDDTHEEVPLIGEKPIDAAFDYAGPIRYVRDQGVIIAFLGEHRSRGQHDVQDPPLGRQSPCPTTRPGLRHLSFSSAAILPRQRAFRRSYGQRGRRASCRPRSRRHRRHAKLTIFDEPTSSERAAGQLDDPGVAIDRADVQRPGPILVEGSPS
jgi:hypothetical protein